MVKKRIPLVSKRFLTYYPKAWMPEYKYVGKSPRMESWRFYKTLKVARRAVGLKGKVRRRR